MKTSISKLPLQRPTWAEVNLDALHANYSKLQKIAAPAKVLAVVKSDAYGHGAVQIATELAANGVSFFGVATAAEAKELREAGIKTPILILSGMTPQQLPLLRQFDFIPSVYTRVFYDELARFAETNQQKIKIHIKIDTGMHRLGFDPAEAREILDHPSSFLEVDGIFTHFACSELANDDGTLQQISLFREFTRNVKANFLHAANSAAILNYPESRFDLVRPGLLLYGISPIGEESDFAPVLTLKSKIVFLNQISAGETIGYGRTFEAKRESLIATVPIGYADGLRRALSNKLKVEVAGVLCPIAGTISMDLCMIDVTKVRDKVQLYDTVTFLGPQTNVWQWAKLLNTIPYEITCLIGARVPRVYYKNGSIYDVYYP